MPSFGALACRDPAIEAFHPRRGVSLRERPDWEAGQSVADEYVEAPSRAPWRVRASFHVDGDACHAELDGSLDVVRTGIVAVRAPDEGAESG